MEMSFFYLEYWNRGEVSAKEESVSKEELI